MSLFNFIDKVGPTVPASYYNALDFIRNAMSASAGGVVTLATTQDNLGRGISICRTKLATTSRASVTIPANDPDLSYNAFTIGATYHIEVLIYPFGTTTGTQGIDLNLNYSGSFTAGTGVLADGLVNSMPVGDVSATIASSVSTIKFGFTPIVTIQGTDIVRLETILIPNSVGTFALAWSQNSSSANATNVGVGSTMTITQVS